MPFDTGLRIEQRYFTEIMQTREASAMIRSLFVSLQELNKGARRPAGVPETKFKKIGVLGAGFMGAGIAYVTAKAGIPVVLLDRDMESADEGQGAFRQPDLGSGRRRAAPNPRTRTGCCR